jgi:hypothetical protein
MYFTPILYLLIATLSAASLFSPQAHHGNAFYPLQKNTNLPPDPCHQSISTPGIVRCRVNYHWCCTLFQHILHCGCCLNFPSAPGSDAAKLSNAEITARTLAEIQNETSVEVLTEMEPGNNETLISLFELQCNKTQHVACVQSDCGFACGCYEKWNTSDISGYEYAGLVFDDFHDGIVETEAVPERTFEEGYSGKSDEDVEFRKQSSAADFSFQILNWVACPIGTYQQCCPVGCRTICFCSDAEECF